MKSRTLLGLAVVGGAYYAHRRRGGQLTLESLKDSLDALREGISKAFQKTVTTTDTRPQESSRDDDELEAIAYDADIVETVEPPFKDIR